MATPTTDGNYGNCQIHVKDVILYGSHGLYKEENVLTAPFLINFTCSYIPTFPIVSIDSTINYEAIFDIIKALFATPYQLLETLAYDCMQQIKSKFNVATMSLTIIKQQPPIAAMQGQVGITLNWSSK